MVIRRRDDHLLTKPLMKMGTVTGKTERQTASWIRSDLFKSYIGLHKGVARVIIEMVVSVICDLHISLLLLPHGTVTYCFFSKMSSETNRSR